MDLATYPGSTPLTGIKCVDLAILQHLDDESLKVLPVCSSELCRFLWKNKLVEKYGQWSLDCKPEFLGYCQHYLSLDDVHPMSTGEGHIVVVRGNGNVYSSGLNWEGQLGLGDNAERPGTPGTDEAGVGYLVQVPEPIRSVACGVRHTILLARKGNVYSFGSNLASQLGFARCYYRSIPTRVPKLPPIRYVACGHYHTVALGFEGDVYVFGSNMHGQMGMGDTSNAYGADCWPHPPTQIQVLPPIRMAAAGNYFTVLLAFNGAVYTCGDNTDGQLGLGDTAQRFVFTQILGIPPIRYVACGEAHTVLLASNGTLYSFGYNSSGELGLGDIKPRSSPTEIQGLPPIRSIGCGSRHTVYVGFDDNAYYSGKTPKGDLPGATVPTRVTGVPQGRIRHTSSGCLPVLLDSDGDVHFLDRSVRIKWPWGTT